MELAISTSTVADATVVRLSGAADLTTIARLDAALRRETTNLDTPRLVVDLDELTVIDELALGSLLGAAARTRGQGGEFALVATADRVVTLLRATRVDEIVDVRSQIT